MANNLETVKLSEDNKVKCPYCSLVFRVSLSKNAKLAKVQCDCEKIFIVKPEMRS